MKKFYITVENIDTTVNGPVRMLAADRIRANSIARMNNMEWSDNPQCQALLAFAAMRRASLTQAENFDDWLAQVADFEITDQAPESEVTTDPTYSPMPPLNAPL